MIDKLPVFVCGTCGCKEIEVLAWTGINTKQFSEWLNEVDETGYCPDCGVMDREVVNIEDYKTTEQ